MSLYLQSTNSFWRRTVVRWTVALASVFVFSVIIQMLYIEVRVWFVRYLGRVVIEPLVMAGDIVGQTYWILLKQNVLSVAGFLVPVFVFVFVWFMVTRWLGYQRTMAALALAVVLLLFGLIAPAIVMPSITGERSGCLLPPGSPGSPPPVGCGPSVWTRWLPL